MRAAAHVESDGSTAATRSVARIRFSLVERRGEWTTRLDAKRLVHASWAKPIAVAIRSVPGSRGYVLVPARVVRLQTFQHGRNIARDVEQGGLTLTQLKVLSLSRLSTRLAMESAGRSEASGGQKLRCFVA